jgi:stage III sporulation protein AA
MKKEVLIEYLSESISSLFERVENAYIKEVEELRLRAKKPLIVKIKTKEYYLSKEKGLTLDMNKAYRTSIEDIKKTLELMSNFSLYSIGDELKNGYITLPGGHRVGISGKTVSEGGLVKTISYVSGLNIRLSHEIIGCSDKIIEEIALPNIKHTLIISPPGCGKTTLLRDIARQLSNGVEGMFKGVNTCIVDERSEIAGCYMGVAQNDIGVRTDVLDGCPKAVGMMMFLRSMAPKVIIVDEIGSKDDVKAIESIVNAGVKIISTIHGNSIEDVMEKPDMAELIKRRIFERYILLGYKNGPGHIEAVYGPDLRRVNI